MSLVMDKNATNIRPSSALNSSKLSSSSKIKFADTVDKHSTSKGLNTSVTSNSAKSRTKTLNDSILNGNSSILSATKTIKKPIIEYNAIGNVPIESEKTTLYSTWTPLSDEQTNNKLFEERKVLVNKWFDNWNDRQRKIVLEEVIGLCKPRQLIFARELINKSVPVYHQDFTRLFPRVINMYIFSFLDPRSLSRCSQVCWNWKTLAESDQLWMPKCLRFGWTLSYTPSPYETGIWKRFYIENIKALQLIPTKEIPTPLTTERSEFTVGESSRNKFDTSFLLKNSSKLSFKVTPPKTLKNPPWRGNSFNPNHTFRFNYLENEKEDNEKRKNHLIKTLSLDSPSNIKPRNAITKKPTLTRTLSKNQIDNDEKAKTSNRPSSTASTANNIRANASKQVVDAKKPPSGLAWKQLDPSDDES